MIMLRVMCKNGTIIVGSRFGMLGAGVAAALTLFVAGGCGNERTLQKAKTNVILVVVDTLRADHLGCYGYFRDTSPNIDAFAREALLFEQAYAPMATTLPSHTSLFTGLYPLEHGTIANFGDGGAPFTSRPGVKPAAECFRENGYTTGAFVSAAPMKSVTGISAGFMTYGEPQNMNRSAKLTTTSAIKWLDSQGKEPFFLFVHYFDPHTPYRPPDEFRRLFRHTPELDDYLAERGVPEQAGPGLCRGRAPTITVRAMNLYDGEIRFCDSQIGLLFEALKERGLWDRSVIVLAADHGEGLNQHDWPQHGRTWNEQVHVPLMMRFPGQTPGVFTQLTSLIDVFPTVFGQMKAAWAGDFLAQARGLNVLAPEFRERPVLSQRSARDCGDLGGPLYAYTTPAWRYHYTPERPELLFNRRLDPFELKNACAADGAECETLRRALLAETAELIERGEKLKPDDAGTPAVDPEYRKHMESLGYIDELEEAAPQEQSSSRPASQPVGASDTP